MYPPLDRALTQKEYDDAVLMAKRAGLNRLDNRQRGIFL